jgi:hypothetical protein
VPGFGYERRIRYQWRVKKRGGAATIVYIKVLGKICKRTNSDSLLALVPCGWNCDYLFILNYEYYSSHRLALWRTETRERNGHDPILGKTSEFPPLLGSPHTEKLCTCGGQRNCQGLPGWK